MALYWLLLNRGSGGNDRGLDPRQLSRTVESIFAEQGHEVRSSMVEPGAIDRSLNEAMDARPQAILIAGGDGTVSAAARQLGGSATPLGILPMGTFNLAARDVGVPLEMEEAVRFLASAEALPVDVLDVGGHACLCTLILGFYPEFARTFERRDHGGLWWKKALRLAAGLPRYFSEARPIPLSWDGDARGSARTKFAAFVPGRYKATRGIVPARTDFRSGSFTAYIGTQRSAAAAVRGMLDYVFGRQEENPELLRFQASRLELRGGSRKDTVVMLDGEILRMRFPIRMEIKPGHLHVLTTRQNLADEEKTAA